MSRESFLADCAAHGIDPDDRRYYQPDAYYAAGETWCPCCRLHSVERPTVRCTLQQAKAAKIRGGGREAAYCWSCHAAFEGTGTLRCPDCEAKHLAEVAKQPEPPKYLRSNAVYRDDGHGCVERVSTFELAVEAESGFNRR